MRPGIAMALACRGFMHEPGLVHADPQAGPLSPNV